MDTFYEALRRVTSRRVRDFMVSIKMIAYLIEGTQIVTRV